MRPLPLACPCPCLWAVSASGSSQIGSQAPLALQFALNHAGCCSPSPDLHFPLPHCCTGTAGGQENLSDDQARKAVDSCAQMLTARFDEKRGGFGNAPKFPRPAELNLLLVKHLVAKAAGSTADAGLPLLPAAAACKQACHINYAALQIAFGIQ